MDLKVIGGIHTLARVAGWLKSLDKLISKGVLFRGSQAMMVVSAVVLLFLCGMVGMDVVYRNIGTFPPWRAGSFEMSELSMALVTGLSFLWCWYMGGHIRVGYTLDKVPLRVRYGLNIFASFCGVIFVGGMTWALVNITLSSKEMSSATPVLGIPIWPFQLLFTIAMGLFTLALLRSIVSYALGAFGHSFDWWTVDIRDIIKREETKL